MTTRSVEEIEEEFDEEDDVIEEIFVEEDEDEVGSEDNEEERKKRVCAGFDGEGKTAVAVSVANQQQHTQRCQADNCDADLGAAKKYHQRHKVCENHSKAKVVLVAGVEQRYCQQCSRFHELSEFDDAKRSCRERLAHHNERRRKIPPEQQQTEDPGQIPVVLQVKDSSAKQARSWKPRGHSEVMKIALPRNPAFKHFQIR